MDDPEGTGMLIALALAALAGLLLIGMAVYDLIDEHLRARRNAAMEKVAKPQPVDS